jgi:hypothetical protein
LSNTSSIDKRDRIRRDIERTQDELEGAVLELRRAVEGGLERIDLRRRIVADPVPWLVGGFVVGLMLGMRR